MAVDAARPFENDDAIDFLIELADDPSFDALADAMRAVNASPPTEYLDVDLGASAVAAVEVLVRALDGGKPEGSLRARTLATMKKALAEQPAARRAWTVTSARAALERATGAHSELADQWDEVSGRRNVWRRDVKRLDKRLARLHEALTIGLAKKRPKRLPKEAVFNKKEGHFEIEPRDARRRAHGLVTFFRPDGSLEATATFEHGVMHGPYRRVHESGELSVRGTFERGRDHGTKLFLRSKKPTSELAFDDVNEVVVKIECDFIRGCARTTRWFDAEDHLVTIEGERWPSRPKNVPAEACFNGGEGWVDGSSDEQQLRHGTWRFWDRKGTRKKSIRYVNGRPAS